MYRSHTTVSILGALFCAALLVYGCGGDKNGANAQQAKTAAPQQQAQAPKPMGLPVKAEPVTVKKVVDEVSAVGSLLAEESVIIRPEIDGRIVGLHFQEGQAVSAGQRLVTLDSTEYEAQLAAVQADMRTEQQRYTRGQELFQQKFISKEALDVQAGAVDRLKARVDEAQARVAKMLIRAPFSGIVGLREKSPGAYVKAGDDIVRLENVSSIKVDFRIPEVYLGKVGRNPEVAVRLDSFPGEQFTGRVYAVQPVVEQQTRTLLMRARVPNKGLKLKPGMFGRIVMTLETRPNAITVPEQAIWPQGQYNYVYRVVDGKAVLTKIEIGTRQPGQVEVVSGLGPNDMVITEGQIKMRDGAPVTVMGAPPAPAPAGQGGAPAPQQAQGEKKAG